MTLGGRAAESSVFHEGDPQAPGRNDIEEVASISKQDYASFRIDHAHAPTGMSGENRSPRACSHQPRTVRSWAREMSLSSLYYSEEMAREIDDEIRRVIEEAHETALHGPSRDNWTA